VKGSTTRGGPEALAARVKAHARAVGFDLCGITGTSAGLAFERYAAAMDAGYGADMTWLYEAPGVRRDVREVHPEARSVIVVAVSYADPSPGLLEAPAAPNEGYIARYARGRDYHDLIRQRLVQLVRRMAADKALGDLPSSAHRVFTDTGPVLEKAFAQAAGLGWIGKNTLLIHPGQRGPEPVYGPTAPEGLGAVSRTAGRGSYYLLGVVLTPLELDHDTPETDHCGTCTRCLDICPTSAFPKPYVLDARRCISHWTIESADPARDIDPARIGPHVFGCDLCQDVCPYNRKVAPTTHHRLAPRPENVRPKLDALAELDDEGFMRRFPSSAVRRVTAAHMRTVVERVRRGREK
jgi:epoxyqueuosine reductase